MAVCPEESDSCVPSSPKGQIERRSITITHQYIVRAQPASVCRGTWIIAKTLAYSWGTDNTYDFYMPKRLMLRVNSLGVATNYIQSRLKQVRDQLATRNEWVSSFRKKKKEKGS